LPQFYLTTREGLAEALRLTHRALELDPRFGLAAAAAGVCHLNNILYGYAADPQFDRKEAVRLLRLALSIDDDDPETLAAAAVTSAFMVGDSEGEIQMADRAVALNPNSFFAWAGRGHVHRIAGLPEEAVRSYERAIRMSPADPRLHFTFLGMGLAFIQLGRFDEAIVLGRKRFDRTPPFRQLTAVLRPLSPISDEIPRPVRRRRVCLRSIPPSQYPRGWVGADNQT
jgi:adenylate cyclase